ncbi:unnamed protein product [Rotaria sordida]|uniref:MULE transposase domain-containing protein n=1 Tax=Rotaria sordida TaxID=392033 RepID=A0A814GUG4_9BILA|nr:unnamed protein product [Rotaria sordida]
MLLFGSVTQLELLFDSSIILMDGVFTCTPLLFDHVFTIHAVKFETSFPCVFGLLPNRKKTTYQQLFKILKDLAFSINRIVKPSRIMSDFEISLIPAVANERYIVVFFHYTQAIYQRIQTLRLTIAYSQNGEIRTCCRKFMALALLPIDQAESSFYILRKTASATVKPDLHQLFLYFDNRWITIVPLNIWNIHGFHHRTNNICEGIHV